MHGTEKQPTTRTPADRSAAVPGTVPPFTILEAGRAIRALDDARDYWDDRATTEPAEKVQERAERARDRLDDQRDALVAYVLAMPAATLPEALVQVDAALASADMGAGGTPVGYDDRKERFEQLRRALSSIAGVLIREAGIDPADVCARFTTEAVAREFPHTAGESWPEPNRKRTGRERKPPAV